MYSPLSIRGPGASWSQGIVWLAFVDSLYRLQDCDFLACDVCPLVGKAGLEACASFLQEGLVPAPWWVELGLVPLVGRVIS